MRHLHLVPNRRSDFERDCPVDPMVQALLEHVRIIAPLPRAVRARALARARAAIAEPRSARLTARSPARSDLRQRDRRGSRQVRSWGARRRRLSGWEPAPGAREPSRWALRRRHRRRRPRRDRRRRLRQV